MRLAEEEVRRAVRAEAAAHVPDRNAMLDRLTRTAMRNEAGPRRSPARIRIAGAAVAVTALLGGGGLAQWSFAGSQDVTPEPGPLPTTASPSPSPSFSSPAPRTSASASSGSATSGSPASAPATSESAPATSAPATTTGGSAPATSGVPATGSPVWTDGSVDAGDNQGTGVVTVRTTEQLDALAVTIRVTRTPGLSSRGGSRQVSGASVTTTVTELDDALLYRFVLSSADTVLPGTYTFSARYSHAAGGRDATGDTYEVQVTTAAGVDLDVGGDFE